MEVRLRRWTWCVLNSNGVVVLHVSAYLVFLFLGHTAAHRHIVEQADGSIADRLTHTHTSPISDAYLDTRLLRAIRGIFFIAVAFRAYLGEK